MKPRQIFLSLGGAATAVFAIAVYFAAEVPPTPTDSVEIEKRVEVKNASSGSTNTNSPPASSPVLEQPTSFNAAPDLFKFAQGALQSKSETVVYEGYIAARECAGIVSTWNDLAASSAVAATNTHKGPENSGRQLSIQALAAKCAGFMSVGLRQSNALAKQLFARAHALGGEIAKAEKKLGEQATDVDATQIDALETLVFSNSPAAMESGLNQLGLLWAKANGIETTDPKMQSIGIAAMLAACDLGKDCNADSYSTHLRCALGGPCNKTLWEDWRADLSEAEIQQVVSYRSLLNDVVRNRDLSKMGISRK